MLLSFFILSAVFPNLQRTAIYLASTVGPTLASSSAEPWLKDFSGGQAWAKPQLEPLTIATAKGDLKLNVEVARSPEEKALGLMFRTNLADDTGMLFAYDSNQIITMWMKNTYIPLDMVFIGADGVIVRIAVMSEPFSEEIISSVKPARFVLELAGGAAARLGVKAGDLVRHKLISNAAN